MNRMPELRNLRRIVALLVALTALLGAPALVGAQDTEGSGPDNIVNVGNGTDATIAARGAVQVAPTGAERATPTNLAIARSHDCTGCQTLAAAYQAVFITGDPEYFSPRNAAVATNTDCEDCGAFAYAYQYVIDTDGPARLSDAGRDKVDDVRAEANRLLDSGMTYDQLDAELHELAQRFRAIVDSELRSSGTEVEDRQSHERIRQTGD
jgi:hypothetical protein